MLDFLPAPLKGTLAALMILLNTLVLYPVLTVFALIKLIIPITAVRKTCTVALNGVARAWIGFNNLLVDLLHQVEWDVRGVDQLSRDHWYFVTCNHQSWADIPAIQYVMNRRIPLLKFFLKKELIWVPLLGGADLGTTAGAGLVGAGFSVHAPAHQGTDCQAAGTEGQGHCRDQGRM